jgi:tRNA/rRNA methyltransferase
VRELVVVLVRSEGLLNVGSVARLCGNFGATLRLVDVDLDLTSRDAIKMAHPSEDILSDAARFNTLADALHDVEVSLATSSKMSDAVLGPAFGLEEARRFSVQGRIALVFGNERTGLAVDEAAACTRTVRLPLPAETTRDSLNLSHAVCMLLTVFAVAGDAPTDLQQARATSVARATLHAAWTQSLMRAGFFRTTTPEAFAPRLQEILDKMDISNRDAQLMFDMFAVLGKRR